KGTDGNTAIARNANHLAAVIDGCGSTGAVARQRREFLHGPVRLPDDCAELQDLESRITGWIVNPILRPPHHLTFVVHAGGVAAEAAGERWQRCHLPVLPAKALANAPRRNACS